MVPLFLLITFASSIVFGYNNNTVQDSNLNRKLLAKATAQDQSLSNQFDQLDQEDGGAEFFKTKSNLNEAKKRFPLKSAPLPSFETSLKKKSSPRLQQLVKSFSSKLRRLDIDYEKKKNQIQKENVWLQEGLEKIQTFRSRLLNLQKSIENHKQQLKMMKAKKHKIRDQIKKSLENKLAITKESMEVMRNKALEYSRKESKIQSTMISLQKALVNFNKNEKESNPDLEFASENEAYV